MGKQYNKVIKKRRRLAYIQRKEAAQVAAAKAPAAKPASKAAAPAADAAPKPAKKPAKPKTLKTVWAWRPTPSPAPQIDESQAPVPST